MKHIMNTIITILYGLMALALVIGTKMKISIINADTGIYLFVISMMLTLAMIKILWQASDKIQNIAVAVLVLIYLLCFKLQIILVLGILAIKLLGRYERTQVNKLMKVASIVFLILTGLNIMFAPALVSGYQEAGDNVYRILESEEGDNIVIISNYDTSEYGNRGYVEISFSKKRFGLFRDEIAHHQMIYQLRLNYEWLDNDRIMIYETIYEFDEDSVLRIEPEA